MFVLFARLREVASPILRKGGDSDARGTRLPATGPVAWTYSGRRVRLIHHLGSQNRRLHAESDRADVNGIGRRALWRVPGHLAMAPRLRYLADRRPGFRLLGLDPWSQPASRDDGARVGTGPRRRRVSHPDCTFRRSPG